MIYLSSKDKFVQESLTNLIFQINPLLITTIKDLSFVHIEANQANDQLYFTYNKKKEIIKTPIKINNIFDGIYKLIFEKAVIINGFEFINFLTGAAKSPPAKIDLLISPSVIVPINFDSSSKTTAILLSLFSIASIASTRSDSELKLNCITYTNRLLFLQSKSFFFLLAYY